MSLSGLVLSHGYAFHLNYGDIGAIGLSCLMHQARYSGIRRCNGTCSATLSSDGALIDVQRCGVLLQPLIRNTFTKP
jgi:hypothetical protein